MLIRVLIVDDSVTIRAMIHQVLLNERDIEVIGQAADATEAAQFISRFRPDVITLDMDMPGISGLEFLSDIMARHPYPVVIVSSRAGEGSELCRQAVDLGALHCFNKAHLVSRSKALIEMIRKAALYRREHPEKFYAKVLPNRAGVANETM